MRRGSPGPGAASAGPAKTTLRVRTIEENFMAGYLKLLGGTPHGVSDFRPSQHILRPPARGKKRLRALTHVAHRCGVGAEPWPGGAAGGLGGAGKKKAL